VLFRSVTFKDEDGVKSGSSDHLKEKASPCSDIEVNFDA
jgi:hypothetical protein